MLPPGVKKTKLLYLIEKYKYESHFKINAIGGSPGDVSEVPMT